MTSVAAVSISTFASPPVPTTRPAHVVAVRAGQVPVEHDHVVGVHPDPLQRGVAVVADVDGHGQPAQPLGDGVREELFVLHDQHPHAGQCASPGDKAGISDFA